MGFDVRGREENRLTSHPHVVLTPMDSSDRSPTSSSICAIKYKDDGLPRRQCIMQAHVYGAEFWVGKFRCIERNRNVLIWEPVDLAAVWQCQTKLRETIESRVSHPLVSAGEGTAR